MKKTVIHYFKTHPNSNECFSTSDGFLFHDSGAASAHSDSLKDKSVKSYRRDEYTEDIEKYDPNAEEKKEAEVKPLVPTATGKGKGAKGKKGDKPGDDGKGGEGEGEDGGSSSDDTGAGEGK